MPLRVGEFPPVGPPPVAGVLGQEFVFPSGRRCRSIEDFVQGCNYEWEDARNLLKQGAFSKYFTSNGRIDLAKSAREAEAQADLDMGLVQFLSTLPASAVAGPRLDLNPRRLILGTWRPGETRIVPLVVQNTGRGMLQGKLTVAEGRSWLWIESDLPGDNMQSTIRTGREQTVNLRIDTRGLVAPQSYSARLTVITNGGIVEVPVRLDLGSLPFAKFPFQGVSSPRELAERMRGNPKPAAPMLESGEIRQWFEANGWTYPVQGFTAKGIAAVQQFFEAMGLSKPPVVELSHDKIACVVSPGQVVEQTVSLRTANKKWVYAEVTSNVPWVRIKTSQVAGAQQAPVTFEIDSRQLGRGDKHVTQVRMLANGGQELLLPIIVELHRPPRSLWDRVLRPFLSVAIALLIYRLALLIPLDLIARLFWTSTTDPQPGTLAAWAEAPNLVEGCLTHFVLLTCWIGPLVGGWLLWQRTGHWLDAVWGANAGVLMGVIVSAGVVCLLGVIEMIPRVVMGSIPAKPPAFVATILWLFAITLWWLLLGGLTGVGLPFLGARGVQIQQALVWPLLGVLRPMGLIPEVVEE